MLHFTNTYLKWFIGLLVLPLLFLLSQCGVNEPKDAGISAYLNLNDTVSYVGMENCVSCHVGIHNTYMHTGMGLSFDKATKTKSKAKFDKHAIVYDTINNFYYKPFWQADSFYIKEFRLDSKGDTIHKRVEYVSYIVGSGHHTNSHMINVNGYVYQAPITYYTQKQQWDLAPGFENGENSRFDRLIAHECMTCHNAIPQFDYQSVNMYNYVPTGIDCERCHGPGELHVKEKLAGVVVDTSKGADYTIVNPKRLSKPLQMSICQRCHIQGIAVLQAGKQFDDFRPGMNLSEVMEVFLPEIEGGENEFLMASQAERLVESKCYKLSEMTCITCHNPHVSVNVTPIDAFNAVCKTCHNTETVCTEKQELRTAKNDNCSGCHMPKSGSIDIPHVSITDHYIRKDNFESRSLLSAKEIEGIRKFIGLECITNEKPDNRTRAQAYLNFYEKFSPAAYVLDSAGKLINQFSDSSSAWIDTKIHYYFLSNQNAKIIETVHAINSMPLTAWTNYRIAEAYNNKGNIKAALPYYKKSVELMPYHLAFKNKLAAAYVQFGDIENAIDIYKWIIKTQPKFKEAWCNLGYLNIALKQYGVADSLLNRAIQLDPDYVQAWKNKLSLCLQIRDKKCVIEIIERLKTLVPNNSEFEKIEILIEEWES